MRARDSKGWAEWVRRNQASDVDRGVVSLAERWADLMEQRLVGDGQGQALMTDFADIAERSGDEAGANGASETVYHRAANALVLYWEHGSLLKRWWELRAGQRQTSGD
jgi:hypothetical protein